MAYRVQTASTELTDGTTTFTAGNESYTALQLNGLRSTNHRVTLIQVNDDGTLIPGAPSYGFFPNETITGLS